MGLSLALEFRSKDGVFRLVLPLALALKFLLLLRAAVDQVDKVFAYLLLVLHAFIKGAMGVIQTQKVFELSAESMTVKQSQCFLVDWVSISVIVEYAEPSFGPINSVLALVDSLAEGFRCPILDFNVGL